MEHFALNIGNRYFSIVEHAYPRTVMNALRSASKQKNDTIENFIQNANKNAGISWIRDEIILENDLISRAYIANFNLTFVRQAKINNEIVSIGIGKSR